VTGFLGPTGAGKSTTMRVITGSPGGPLGSGRAGPSPLLAPAFPDHDRLMKKMLVLAAVFAAIGVLARLFGPKMRNIDWAKKVEAMPENAPPKWMFRNITAIRENTDRILELLESGRTESAQQTSPPPGG
jgi:hypothetical protein